MLKSSLLFTAALFLLLSIYWFPMLSGAASFFVSDHAYYFEPFARFIGEAFSQLRLPQWNPYLYCGMSQLAVPSPGIFYPTSLLFALGSYSQALASQMLLHQLLAGCGMFLLVSSLGWGRASATTAALSYSLCGYLFALTTNCTLAFGACCLPVLLWSFRSINRAVSAEQKKSLCWFLICGSIAVFLLITAGRPEVFAPGLLLLGAFCLLDGMHDRKRGIDSSLVYRAWCFQALALLTGLALSMPTLLPVLEWAALSPRAKGLPASQVLMWSANWYDFTIMLYPQPFGDLLVLGSKYLRLVATRATFYPYITSLFVGPVCFSLAVWGFFDTRWSWRKWLFCGLAFFVLLALGDYTPVAPCLVRTFNSVSLLRYPVKLMIFPIILLSVAAARGTRNLLNHEVSITARYAVVAFWMVSLVLGLVLIGTGLANVTLAIKYGLPPFASTALGKSMIGSSLIGLTCSLGEYLHRRNKLSRKQVGIIVSCGLALNLGVVAICNRQMTTPGDFYKHKQTLETWISSLEKSQGQSGRLLGLYFDPLETPKDYQAYPGAYWTADFFSYSRELLLCNTVLDSHRPDAFGYEAAETGAYREMVLTAIRDTRVDKEQRSMDTPEKVRFLDLPLLHFCQSTGSKWVSTQVYKHFDLRKLNPAYFELVREDSKMNLRLYEVRGATPRAYFAENWKWADSNATGIKAALTAPGAYLYAPLSQPLVEKDSAAPVPRSLNALAPEIPKAPQKAPTSPYSDSEAVLIDKLDRAIHPLSEITRVATQAPNSAVTVMLDIPEHVSVSASNKKDGFLILCDHFYPGWCVFVDSVQVPLLKVNAEMRGVYLPAGSHLVEFDFRSESLKNGLICASAGLTLLLAYFFIAVWPAFWRFIKSTAGQ